MFGIKIQHDPDRRYLERARVSCPLGGADIDIERCWACARLLRLVDGDLPYVVCTARRDPRPPYELK